jgi:hypothetical protein
LGSCGLYHYNKLTYLFEYYFIKNFGKRYTGEEFVKLPHGPTIVNYKKQISELSKVGMYNVDLSVLSRNRKVDDFDNNSVPISSTEKTRELLLAESLPLQLLTEVLKRFALMPVAELETFVYQTKPLQMYQKSQSLGYKKKVGGYVLKGECIRFADFQNPQTAGRMLALNHIQKYPAVNVEQHRKLSEEVAFIESMHPSLE